MDDIRRRADNEAWDRRVERRISDINEGIEQGVKGEALAALHGLHVAPDDEPPYDVDDRSDVDDQETLRGKIVSRRVQIENTIAENRDLPDEVKQRWIRILHSAIRAKRRALPCCATSDVT